MEKNRIGIGTKVMWYRNHIAKPYADYFVDTIVSETKTEFKTNNKTRIKKDTLYIVGEPFIQVEIYDEQEYKEKYLKPREKFLVQIYITRNIDTYVKSCDKKDLDEMYIKIRNVIEKNEEAK